MIQLEEICHVGRCDRGCTEVCLRALERENAAPTADEQLVATLTHCAREVAPNYLSAVLSQAAERIQRLAENAEIVEVYDKLHKHNVVGGHWMWGMVAQAAESGDAEQAARDHGLVRMTEGVAADAERYRMLRQYAKFFGDETFNYDGEDGDTPFANTTLEQAAALLDEHVDRNIRRRLGASEVNDGAASLNSGAAKDD